MNESRPRSGDAGWWAVVTRALGRLRRVAGMARRGLRAVVDGTLHPVRRRRARALVRSLQSSRHVLFLCLGNVCRSPYGEARFRDLARRGPDRPEARSAGFIGPGRAPPQTAQEAAARRGLDTSGHTSRVVTSEAVEPADLVVVMEPSQRRRLRRTVPGELPPVLVLGDLDPEPIRHRSVRDPWGDGGDVFDGVFARIDRCVAVLGEELGVGRARAER